MEEQHLNRSGKGRKIALITLAVLAFIILATQLTLMFYLDPKAEEYIIEKVHQRTQGQYSVRFENISLNIFTQSIKASSVYFTPVNADTVEKIRRDEVEIFIPEISAKGLNIWAALWDREIIISNVFVDKPRFIVERNSRTDANPSQFTNHPNYYRLLKGIFKSALVKELAIKEGYFELYKLLDQYDYVATIQSVDINLENVALDSTKSSREYGHINLGAVEGKLSAFSQRSPDSTYLLSVGQMDISSKKSQFLAKEINLMPLVAPDDEVLNRNIIYEVYTPEFRLNNIDLEQLYFRRELKLPAIKVVSPAIKVLGTHISESRNDSITEINLYPLVSEYIKTLHIEKVQLENTKLDLVHLRNNQRANIANADIFLYDFKMDSTLLLKRNKLFYSEKVFVKLEDQVEQLPDELLLDHEYIKTVKK